MVDECVNDCNITYKMNCDDKKTDIDIDSQQATVPDRDQQREVLLLARKNVSKMCRKILHHLRLFLEFDSEDANSKLVFSLTQSSLGKNVLSKYEGAMKFFGFLGLCKYESVSNNEHFVILPKGDWNTSKDKNKTASIEDADIDIDIDIKYNSSVDSKENENVVIEVNNANDNGNAYNVANETLKTENNWNNSYDIDTLPQRLDIIDPIILSYAFRAVDLCRIECKKYFRNVLQRNDFTTLLDLNNINHVVISHNIPDDHDDNKDENKFDSNSATTTTAITSTVPRLLSPNFAHINIKDSNGLICSSRDHFYQVLNAMVGAMEKKDACILLEKLIPFVRKFENDDRYRILYLSNKSVVRIFVGYTAQTLNILALLGYEWRDSKCDTLICKVAPPTRVTSRAYRTMEKYLERLTERGYNPNTKVDENGKIILGEENRDKQKRNTNESLMDKDNKLASKYYMWFSYVAMVWYVIDCIVCLLILIEVNNPQFGNKYNVLFYISLSSVLITQCVCLRFLWFRELHLDRNLAWYHQSGLILLSVVCSSAIPVILYFASHKHSKLRLKYLAKLGYCWKRGRESSLDSIQNHNDIITNVVQFKERAFSHHLVLIWAVFVQMIPIS